MSPTIYVSEDQIDAARALIRVRGGNGAVDPMIVAIANAEQASLSAKGPAPGTVHSTTVRVSGEQMSAARALIRLRGGEQHVDEVTRRIALATLPDSAIPSGS